MRVGGSLRLPPDLRRQSRAAPPYRVFCAPVTRHKTRFPPHKPSLWGCRLRAAYLMLAGPPLACFAAVPPPCVGEKAWGFAPRFLCVPTHGDEERKAKLGLTPQKRRKPCPQSWKILPLSSYGGQLDKESFWCSKCVLRDFSAYHKNTKHQATGDGLTFGVYAASQTKRRTHDMAKKFNWRRHDWYWVYRDTDWIIYDIPPKLTLREIENLYRMSELYNEHPGNGGNPIPLDTIRGNFGIRRPE